MSIPFVFKFKNNNDNYIYDINTNNILKVDNPLFELIDQDLSNKSKFLEKYKNIYSLSLIEKVTNEIKKNKEEKGLFQGKKSLKMFFPFTKKEYKLILDNLLSHVILNATEDCNNRCEYCKFSGQYLYARSHSKKYMEETVGINAVKFMLKRARYIFEKTDRHVTVGFYGGEPLLNFKLIKKCTDYINTNFRSIRDRISFSITTNLTILNEEIMDVLISNNFNLLVSLDGPKEIHDRYRKSISGKGTFETVMKNLNRIKKANLEYYNDKVGFSIVLSPPYDLFLVRDFFEQIDSINNRVILLSFIDEEDTKFFDRFRDMDKINEKLKTQLKELKKEFKKLLIKEERDSFRFKFLLSLFGDRVRDIYRRYLVPLSENIYPNGICLPGLQKFLVSPEGKFYICEKIGYSFPIGNIQHGFDVEVIFRLIQEYIRISQPMCSNCWAVRFCRACFLRAMKENRLDVERKRENCAMIRRSIENGLKLFCEIMKNNPKAFEFFKESGTDDVFELAFKFIEEYKAENFGNKKVKNL